MTFSESFSMQQKGGVKREILLGNKSIFSWGIEHEGFHSIVLFPPSFEMKSIWVNLIHIQGTLNLNKVSIWFTLDINIFWQFLPLGSCCTDTSPSHLTNKSQDRARDLHTTERQILQSNFNRYKNVFTPVQKFKKDKWYKTLKKPNAKLSNLNNLLIYY